MARKKILPAPRDPIIPDTQPVDMELSDGEDENGGCWIVGNDW